MCQAPLRAKFRAISTDFGCARVSIRAAAHVWPPWFPVGVGVVMLAGFPTRLDPSALFVVLVAATAGLPTGGVPLFPCPFPFTGSRNSSSQSCAYTSSLPCPCNSKQPKTDGTNAWRCLAKGVACALHYAWSTCHEWAAGLKLRSVARNKRVGRCFSFVLGLKRPS